MVLSKTAWLVALGVLVARLGSLLCEHRYEQFFICLFASLDGICCTLRLPVRFSLFPLLEPQQLDLPATIRAVGPFVHL